MQKEITPMFSIVIPVYNKAHTIVHTLNSVLAQTFKDFEVLIVNDGSTDNGMDVVRSLTTDPRIIIIEQKNQGVSVARNTGVDHAKSKYVAFLDGDDKWLPGYLETMKRAVDSFPDAGMYCCAGIVKNEDGSENLRLAKKYEEKIMEIDFFENPHVFLHTSATIVSKSAFKKAEGFPAGMKRNQDFACFFSVALVSKVVYCAVPLSIYVGGVEGQVTRNKNVERQRYIVDRFNYVFSNWLKAGSKNRTFIIFMKYELRHTFINCLKSKEYELFDFYTKNLDKRIIEKFSNMEIKLLKSKSLNKISILYLYMTKLRWRMHGFPITK